MILLEFVKSKIKPTMRMEGSGVTGAGRGEALQDTSDT